MAEFTVLRYTACIPIRMPALPQGDGHPGYTSAELRAALEEQIAAKFRAVDRAFITWAAGL